MGTNPDEYGNINMHVYAGTQQYTVKKKQATMSLTIQAEEDVKKAGNVACDYDISLLVGNMKQEAVSGWLCQHMTQVEGGAVCRNRVGYIKEKHINAGLKEHKLLSATCGLSLLFLTSVSACLTR